MRRVILAVTGTIAGLVALLGFRSHVPSSAPAVSVGGTSVGGTSVGGTSVGGASVGGTGDSNAAGSPSAEPSASAAQAGSHTVDGNVASTVYGPVQVQVVVGNDKITGVHILEQPTNTANDLAIGQFAFPKLIGETLVAQSAHIDAVSGATYTSAGYIQSLQSAIDRGA
jgi:uncharacterized protein with FMN-binding domain